MSASTPAPIIDASQIRVQFPSGKERLTAVNRVDLAVAAGECVGLVGESGCGKTTLGNVLVGWVRPDEGTVRWRGRDIWRVDKAVRAQFHRDVQMVFQDPYGSLNPRMTVGQTLSEVFQQHQPALAAPGVRSAVDDLLQSTGVAVGYAACYPHELSGGQRQRIGLARALAVNPSLIIADEPVSALDVSVQIQILNLMKAIQQRRSLSLLFVAHDLAVVRYMCHRVLVMYLGCLVEEAPAEVFFKAPAHPYSQALLKVVPDIARGLAQRHVPVREPVLQGEADARGLAGCPFAPRCAFVHSKCSTPPAMTGLSSGHRCACHLHG